MPEYIAFIDKTLAKQIDLVIGDIKSVEELRKYSDLVKGELFHLFDADIDISDNRYFRQLGNDPDYVRIIVSD